MREYDITNIEDGRYVVQSKYVVEFFRTRINGWPVIYYRREGEQDCTRAELFPFDKYSLEKII